MMLYSAEIRSSLSPQMQNPGTLDNDAVLEGGTPISIQDHLKITGADSEADFPYVICKDKILLDYFSPWLMKKC